MPDPVINRPAGLDADAIIGGRPAAFDRRGIDQGATVLWWQLSPPGFPDRWIEVRAVIRGLSLDQADVQAEVDRVLETVSFGG